MRRDAAHPPPTEERPMTMFPKAAARLMLALGCSFAAAAPKDDLHAAFAKFLSTKSFRATVTDMQSGKPVSSMAFVAPDRYRIEAAGNTTLIVGDTMYMDVGGKLQAMPVPVGRIVAQYRNQDFLHEVESGMQVAAVGDDSIDGEPAKVYAYTLTKPLKADARTWVSAKSGRPLQTESSGSFMGHASTTRVRYSGFDDPSIHIDAP
jgi:outer membrane lipoprotein-sorting protein